MAFAPIPPEIPADWPLRAQSRILHVRPHLWHVQVIGSGPVVLMLHGAGGATHSWRHLAPYLAEDFTLVMPDLPGHGFTRLGNRMRCSLDAMAEDLAVLMADQGWAPEAIIGHSAGAALALRMAEVLPQAPRCLAGLNAALENFDGLPGVVFPMLARLLALNPLVPSLFARVAGGRAQVERLLAATGSQIDEEGLRLYERLVRDPAHVDGTLTMMAQWQLDGLIARLPQVDRPTLFLTGGADRTVPPSVSRDAARRMPHAEVIDLPGLGHLMHEEAAEMVAGYLGSFLRQHV